MKGLAKLTSTRVLNEERAAGALFATELQLLTLFQHPLASGVVSEPEELQKDPPGRLADALHFVQRYRYSMHADNCTQFANIFISMCAGRRARAACGCFCVGVVDYPGTLSCDLPIQITILIID